MIEGAKVVLLALAFLLGAMIPVQAGANVAMGRHLPSNLHATVMNFIVGLVALLGATAVMRPQWPSGERLAAAPWWAWVGGLLGAAFVLGTILLAPRLGTVLFLAAVIAGQLCASLAVDHFGLMGFAAQHATPGRIAGVGLVLAGVVVIRLTT